MYLYIEDPPPPHRIINHKDTRAKFCQLKNKPVKGFATGVYQPEAHDPRGLAILKVLNLVRYRVINTCRILYGLQQDSTPLTPSQPHTVRICTLTQGKGGGGWELNQREG
jgi:hypothetical protein